MKKTFYTITSLNSWREGVHESRVSLKTETQVANWVKKYVHPDSSIVGVKIVKKTIMTDDVTKLFITG
jgi:hypothetical protein